MNRFEYADGIISDKQIFVAVPSFVIGIGIITLPRHLASVTATSDGWIPLLIGGIFALVLSYAIAKFAAGFPNQTFLSYASQIVTKPVAILLTFFFTVIALSITALHIRKIAVISNQYLLNETPVEVIGFTFFLVIIYAVSSSRVGLFRLNTLFLPFVLSIAIVVIAFNINWYSFELLLPVFETSFTGYLEGTKYSLTAYAGFSILWFYIALVKNPTNTPKMTALGMLVPIVLYTSLYIASILVFGVSVTANLGFPTIEIAKLVEIPGGILERFESLFFVIWIMAIFNTTAMAFDIAVLSLQTIFKKVEKTKIILFISPISYIISMSPQDIIQVNNFGMVVGYAITIYSLGAFLLLFTIAKIRRIK